MTRTVPLLALLSLALSCTPAVDPAFDRAGDSVEGAAERRPVVRSLSWPVSWLVERLAGDGIDHACVLPAGEDAFTWRPSGELVAQLASADLVVANGAGYEPWTETASLPMSRFVDSSRGLDLIERAAQTHRHGVQSEHTHGRLDPHTFLDPALFAEQARRVAAGLRGVVQEPAHLLPRLAALEADLDTLAHEWDAALGPFVETPPAGADPDWAYLFARLGIQALPSTGPPALGHSAISVIEEPSADGYDYLRQSRAAIAQLEGGAHE